MFMYNITPHKVKLSATFKIETLRLKLDWWFELQEENRLLLARDFILEKKSIAIDTETSRVIENVNEL